MPSLKSIIDSILNYSWLPDVDKMKANGDIKGLIKALNYRDVPKIRSQAVKALVKVGGAEAIPPLTAVVQNYKDDIDIRLEALEALIKVGRAQAIPALMAVIHNFNDDSRIRLEAVEAFVKVGGAKAIPSLIDIIAHQGEKNSEDWTFGKWPVKSAAGKGLGQLATKKRLGTEDLQRLMDALNDPDGSVRSAAYIALGQIQDTRTVGPFMEAMSKETGPFNAITLDCAESVLRGPGLPEPEEDLPNETWVDIWVYHLLGIYHLNPEGFVRDSGSPQVEKIRRIGRKLYERGGMEMMQSAHAEFASRSRIPGAARNLEHVWDRIGDWLG